MKKCRSCGSELFTEVINLKKSPPSNAYLPLENRNSPEIFYPLIIMLCETCYLVQTIDFKQANELFDENYSYLSSIIDLGGLSADPVHWHFNFSVLADLDAGDTALVKWGQDAGATQVDISTQSSFSGYLVA